MGDNPRNPMPSSLVGRGHKIKTMIILMFNLIVIAWGLTALQGHKMFFMFLRKYPDISSKELPISFVQIAHLQKYFYFFTKRAQNILRNDEALWKEWKRFLYLCVASTMSLVILLCFLTFRALYF